jgi:CRP/FNR family transcriptional regulator, cyclic AMP receptor protein
MEPERIASLPLFADLDDADRAEVAACTREVSLAAGETLTAQGENAYEFFVIEAGEAEVHKDGQMIGTVGQGDVVGEIGLLATGARTASIVATSQMTLVAIFSRDFRQIEKRMPAIAESLRATMRERVARTSF